MYTTLALTITVASLIQSAKSAAVQFDKLHHTANATNKKDDCTVHQVKETLKIRGSCII